MAVKTVQNIKMSSENIDAFSTSFVIFHVMMLKFVAILHCYSTLLKE